MRLDNIRAVVTDIEGTTSSLSFVKEVLFPYAREHLGDYVHAHAGEPQVAQLLQDVRHQAGAELDVEGIIDQLNAWIDADKKITPLKALQGLLWEKGYQQGDFRGHIYADAYQQLQAWHGRGIALYVYSSGSVYAQKLLFGHTEYGDLNYLFTDYFDTRIGAKVDATAYREIVRVIGQPAENILFLSDIEAELDAAKSAGLHSCWLLREGEPDSQATYPQVKDFQGIEI
jgi:enolase-phosphatase E1